MATTTSINGTDFVVQYDSGAGYVTVATSTSASLSLSLETRDTSNKASAGWADALYGQRSWSADVEGLLTFASGNIASLWALYQNRTSVTLKFVQATPATGDLTWSGTALLTSLSADAPMEDSMTYSASFQGAGELSSSTN